MFGIDSELEAQFNAKYLDLLGAYRGKEQTSPELPSQMRAVSVAEWKHQSVPLSSSGAYTRRILLGDGLQELFEHIRRVMTVPDTMAHGPYDVTFTCS
jgi:hypothetical protein